ncbi:MAG: hypothetical protein GY714_01745 [Desulfobacterales bacterium]|nr:hypothetical protein [Desulfobacterales bacterium]
MSLNRYYGVKNFTKAVIKSHASGKPFNPAACRGTLEVFYYNDEQKGGYKGKDMSFGTCIRATCMPEYVYTLNLLLDKGANIIAASATSHGILTQCSYTLEETDEFTNEKPQVEDHPIRGTEKEKTSVDETTESSESSTDMPEPTTSESRNLPDWDYAESMSEGVSKTDAKKALEAYALEFGVDLNRGQKFETMMQNFRVEMED